MANIVRRRFAQARPSEQIAKWECEVFVIDKQPMQKRALKHQVDEKSIPVKDLVKDVCERLGILPMHTALFGISYNVFGGFQYLPYTQNLTKDDILKKKLYFRLQFKVDFSRMHEVDPKAFYYFLLQCRHDFAHGRYRENFFQLLDDLKRQEMLLRMLILEILLVSKDENLPKKDGASHLQQILKRRHPFSIENILTRYIDDRRKNKSEEVKKCRKIIEKSLPMFETVNKPELDFVREVGFLPEMARETFKNLKKVYGRNDLTAVDDIWLSIHPDEGITRMRLIDGRFKKADEITPFHNVTSLAIKKNETNAAAPTFQLMIGKQGNQQTEVISSDSEEELMCICSWIDGYYRLFVDQYTSLQEGRRTEASLHGPIEREVCIQLMDSIACVDGDFIIRERRDRYNEFVLTIRVKSEYKHHEIHCTEERKLSDRQCYIEESRKFSKLEDLVKYYREPKKPIRLIRMIKPSNTGPVPFRNGVKSLKALKRQSPPSVEIQLLDSKTIINKDALPKGRFGVVWKCLQRKDTTSKTVAVRYLYDDAISQQGFESLRQCCKQMMSRMIVRITGCSASSDNPKYLAFEFMDGGPLDVYLGLNWESILYRTVLKLIMDVAEGMMYLERELGLVHGNLNCHNILRLENGDIKISDACFDPVLQSDGRLSKEDLSGSCNWRAPEVLHGEKMTNRSDAWSYGMTIWELMSLSKPFGKVTSDDVLKLSQQGTLPSFDVLPYCPEEIKEMLMSCWSLNPLERNTFTEICHRLDVYKKGNEASLKRETFIRFGNRAFPVATHLLNRHYYKWKEEESTLHRNMEKEKRELREMKRRVWQEPSSSSESVNTGHSSSGSGYIVKDQSDTSGYESENVSLARAQAAAFFKTDGSGDPKLRDSSHDVEMADLHEKQSSELMSSKRSLVTETVIDASRVFPGKNNQPESVYRSYSTQANQVTKYNEDLQGRSSTHKLDIVKVDADGRVYTEGQSSKSSTVASSGKKVIIETESDSDSGRKDTEVVTEDVMEVANVLASMAHPRTADQKRPRSSDADYISQKHPRRMSPTRKSIPKVRNKNTYFPPTDVADSLSRKEQLDSGFDSSEYQTFSNSKQGNDGMTVITKRPKHFDAIEQYAPQSPAEPQLYESIERKKRSHSVSEEITKMQKKAARRALDIPNPFNLGTSIPKNFLLSLKEPLVRNQPEDMSKFFNAIPSKNKTNRGSQEGKTKAQKVEEPRHEILSDIRQLEENFSSLKAASPARSATSVDSGPNTPISQALTFVLPQNQQVRGQLADQSSIQSTINAYLANLSQSLVSGSPVYVPQITVNASSGQALTNQAQMLQVLQAQQKISQLAHNNSQDKSIQRGPLPEGTIPVASPDYLQTLLAIFTSKNLSASSAANVQQSLSVPGSTAVQQSHIISTAPGAAANNPIVDYSLDPYKKIVDIKPKPTTDLRKSDPDIVMIPVQNSGGPRFTKTSAASINVVNSFAEGKGQVQRPISVRALPNQRPLFVDSKLQLSRPLLLKRDQSPKSVRSQPLILPKNLPEQLDRIDQSKELKIAAKHDTSLPMTNLRSDVHKQAVTSNEFILSDIKVEPSSPTSPGYISMDHAPRHTRMDTETDQHPHDKVMGYSEKLTQPLKRRKSEDAQSKQIRIMAQLGDLKIFRKEDLTLEKKLGEGQFGEVSRALLKFHKDGVIKQCPVAVKKLKPDDQMPLSIIEEFKNEVKQMASLNNEYIVKLIGVCVDSAAGDLSDPWIITELMPQGSLNQFIVKNRGTIVEDILLNFAVQIAKGMEFLQSCRIVHRDLAARNVLVESRDRVKVCDFGLSRMFGEKGYYRSHNGKALIPVRWFAPESIQELKFTAESDVWSYGVTIWEIFELWDTENDYATPYKELEPAKILDFLEQGDRLRKPKRCSNELWKINLGCWSYNPDERHSFYRLSYEISRLLL